MNGTYPGGKNGAGVWQWLINHMPPHRVYIEPFAGAAAVLRHKLPALSSIALDIDAAAVETLSALPLPNLRVIHGDALTFLRSYPFTGEELVYCDPPYLFGTRASGRRGLYRHEFGEVEEHRALCARLQELPCAVMVSGYHSAEYDEWLRGWRRDRFRTTTRGGRTAWEYVWLNFPEPLELHDYRYLGQGYRERERIKRKKTRWARRWAEMPAQERYAILSALHELYGGGRG